MFTYKYEPIKLDNTRFAILPTALIVWLLLLPLISMPFYETIEHYLQLSLELKHTGKLILAAVILIIVFTFSEIVIFILAFAIGQAVYYEKNIWISFLVTGSLLFVSYGSLMFTMDYRVSFAAPLLAAIIYMGVILQLKLYNMKFRFQALFLFQLLFLVQWLEIYPAMHKYGFGKSDTAQAIVQASYTLETSHILQLTSLLVCLPFLFSTFVTFILIKINTLRIQELERSQKREEELQHMRLEAIESRTNEEMNNLVHDLKTPLTTISGLISLLQLTLDNNKGKEYAERIEKAVGQLNSMISEILSEDVKKPIKLHTLLNYTRAHLVEEQLTTKIQFLNHAPNEVIYVNRIRFARLLINLIENALQATEHLEDGKVEIELKFTEAYAEGEKVEGVLIRVTDNGYGIDSESMKQIWDVKYSKKGSSGLGLPFVRKVVRLHGGWIKAESKVGQETIFTLFIPRGSQTIVEKNLNH